jgi:acetoin utilization deacetylase AcuC-like enzyme
MLPPAAALLRPAINEHQGARMQPLVLMSHPDCLKHRIDRHPESPERLETLMAALSASHLADGIEWLEAPMASQQQLARVHQAQHIHQLFALAPRARLVHLDPDTAMMPATLKAALRAAGSVPAAVDHTLIHHRPVFCAVRPPGHHASAAQAMGFCFFNNLAVGVAHALQQPGIERIAVIDFDVHHGNGTDAIFAGHRQVSLFSCYQHPFYPGTAVQTPYGLPLPAGSDGQYALQQISAHWLEPLQRMQADMLFFSAGFDAHQADPLGGLNWRSDDYRQISALLMQATRATTGGRVVSVLEGGYDLQALSDAVLAHLSALTGTAYP